MRYLAGVALAVLTGCVVPWIRSRVGDESVLEYVRRATESPGLPPILERVRALEERLFHLEQRVRELEGAERDVRRQLCGFLAADAEPRRERKAEAAANARRVYDDLVGSGLTPKAAALQVLSTPPPR